MAREEDGWMLRAGASEPRLLAFYLSTIGDDSLAAYIRGGTDPYAAIVQEFLGRSDFTEE
jgi:hypothetical protein